MLYFAMDAGQLRHRTGAASEDHFSLHPSVFRAAKGGEVLSRAFDGFGGGDLVVARYMETRRDPPAIFFLPQKVFFFKLGR